jgi:hypothetical protein
MKTMSWSRYHCLSWSFMRIRTIRRCNAATRSGQAITGAGVTAPDESKTAVGQPRCAPAAENAGAGHRAPTSSKR